MRYPERGFTLAELLIALAILGVIATFAIPKVLSSQQDTKWKAMAKEAASAFSEAYQAYRQGSTPTSGMTSLQLSPYFNYVKIDTTSQLDGSPGDIAFYSCNNALYKCLLLHNGGVLMLHGTSFAGTSDLNVIWAMFDPDATYTNNASQKSVWFAINYPGRVTSWATIQSGSMDSLQTYNPGNYDPPWFNLN